VSDGSYQSIGNKGIHRAFISIKVLETVEVQSFLFRSIRLGVQQNQAAQHYAEFITKFYELFQSTWLFTKDSSLASDIELFFGADTNIKFNQKNLKPVNKSVELFKQYLQQLKDSGIYDPAIFHRTNSISDAWERSL
jgi:hypothetical protein